MVTKTSKPLTSGYRLMFYKQEMTTTYPARTLPKEAAKVEELHDWSINFDSGANPYCLFLDIIGYSADRWDMPVLTSLKTAEKFLVTKSSACLLMLSSYLRTTDMIKKSGVILSQKPNKC